MALQTHDVNVGSNYEFKSGDVIQIMLAANDSFTVGSDTYTLPTPNVYAKGAVADPSYPSIVCQSPEYTADNSNNKARVIITVNLNPVSIVASEFDNVIVDPTKIQVVRNEVVSAKSKTVVTKEKLTYYHNKIKSWLDTKGKIKSIQMGPYTFTPDANGLVNLPGDIVEMESATNSYTLVAKNYDYNTSSYDNKNLKFDFSQSNKLEISRWMNSEIPTVYNLPSTGYVDGLAAAATKLKLEKVDSLPATGEEGKIYLVPNAGAGVNVYDEYFWYNKGTDANPDYVFELFGTTAVDLTNYIQETDLVEITTSEIDDMFATTP